MRGALGSACIASIVLPQPAIVNFCDEDGAHNETGIPPESTPTIETDKSERPERDIR
jgi:hypothetical protein